MTLKIITKKGMNIPKKSPDGNSGREGTQHPIGSFTKFKKNIKHQDYYHNIIKKII